MNQTPYEAGEAFLSKLWYEYADLIVVFALQIYKITDDDKREAIRAKFLNMNDYTITTDEAEQGLCEDLLAYPK
jgi:hypothetical protein